MKLERKEYKKEDDKKVTKLSEQFKISPQVIRLMLSRGVDSADKITKFLNPDINNFYDPYLFKNMREVVDKINSAITDNLSILIYGDYDVDGMSATSILYLYLKERGVKVNYFLPNRYVDGYGVTKESLNKIKEQFNPNLIITVDCGITAVEEVEHAKSLGIDIIITDHHEVPEVTPNCLIINPKIKGQDYPFNELCGAGVALKLVQALGGIKTLEKYLDIATIATIADIVPLLDENRLIIQLGLKKLNNKNHEGLKLLFKELNIKEPTSTDIAFKVAPKINAAGRMGDATEGLKLFIEEDKKKLLGTIQNLKDFNLERQDLCQKVYDDCLLLLNKVNITKEKIIILDSKEWDAGLLGITAARIADEFNRPTILFSQVEDKFKGSARSIDGIDIHKAISCVKTPIEAFGGHIMAAGLTVDKKHFESFKTELIGCMESHFNEEFFYPKKSYDLDLTPEAIGVKLINEINLLEPFGHKNPLPIFNLSFKNASVAPMKNFPEHLTINFNNKFSMLDFNASQYLPNFSYYKNKNALVQLQLNNFMGKDSVKGIVKALLFKDVNLMSTKELVLGYYLMQLNYNTTENNAKIDTYDSKNLTEMLKSNVVTSKLGTLVVFSNIATFKNYETELKALNFEEYLFEIDSKLGLNAYVLGLSNFKNLNNYNNIIFADAVLNEAYLQNLSLNTNANIYVPNTKYEKNTIKVSKKREIFGLYFNAFKSATRQKVKFNNIYEYYDYLKDTNRQIKNFNFTQFLACLTVFKELTIIEEENSLYNYSLKLNKNIKSSLENSEFYNKLKEL
ncbi:MAG: single-stranded-DNA-specific exonuclease RecJ [Spirochaetales bacterium]